MEAQVELSVRMGTEEEGDQKFGQKQDWKLLRVHLESQYIVT